MQGAVLVDLVAKRAGEDKKIILLLSFRRKFGFLFKQLLINPSWQICVPCVLLDMGYTFYQKKYACKTSGAYVLRDLWR